MFSNCLAPRAPFALSLLAALSTFAVTASAQSQLDPVVVSGTREPQPLSRIAADVVVIDAERIRNSSADSVEDLLRREAGVQLSRTGGPGQGAGLFIRGASSSNTVVLVDGVRVGSSTLGYFDLSALGLSQIDRIEVLRGPGSSLYGADAVGGVVQIFTRRGEAGLRFGTRAAVGGYGSREGDVNASGASGAFDYAAGLGYERSKGVSSLRPADQFGNFNPDRDGHDRKSGQLNLGYTPAAGHRIGLKFVESRLHSRFDSSQFLPPDFAQDASPDFQSRLKSSVAGLDYRGRITSAWTTTAQVSRNVDDLRSGGGQSSRLRTEREQATWQNAWKFSSDQELVVAYEHLNEKAQADTFTSDVKRSNNALVIGYAGTFGAHSIQADVRRDANSVYGGTTTGRLGWSMQVVPGLRVRALAGTTFRAPSFNDLYYPGYGVDTIRPEHGRSIEAGMEWRAGDTQASFTVYRNRVRDLIEYQPDATLCPPGFFGCASNIGRARLQGATLSASQRWGAFSLRGTVDFLDAKNTITGNRLTRRAAHQESLTGNYTMGAWTFGAAVLGVGARPEGAVKLGADATLDLTARWRFAPQWQLEAKLLNATDKDVEPARDYQGLGRQAWIGVRFDGQWL